MAVTSILRDLVASGGGPILMGVVNRTPDSFSDGGQLSDDAAAKARVRTLIADGARIIDVGAESTRPGAEPVSTKEQIARLGDTFRWIADAGAIGSIDTFDPRVAEHALDTGARIINSVSLDAAGDLAGVARRANADLILMHCRGSMSVMSGYSMYPDDGYEDVISDVKREWMAAAEQARRSGLGMERLSFDPGLGFTKNAAQSLELIRGLASFRSLGVPIVVGASRKSFIAKVESEALGREPEPPLRRLGGTIGVSLAAACRGADVLRVHDVAELRQALALTQAIEHSPPEAAARV